MRKQKVRAIKAAKAALLEIVTLTHSWTTTRISPGITSVTRQMLVKRIEDVQSLGVNTANNFF
jgi:hypothetical protein